MEDHQIASLLMMFFMLVGLPGIALACRPDIKKYFKIRHLIFYTGCCWGFALLLLFRYVI